MKRIIQYGWDGYIASTGHFSEEQPVNQANIGSADIQTTDIARVVSVQGSQYEIATEEGNKRAELLGKLLFAAEKHEQPKVGDWVKFMDYDEQALISEVLPRYSELSRKSAGKSFEKQVMVANADRAVIIQGLDHDFNINRIERYIVQVVSCGIEPVVILNKADLVEDVSVFTGQIRKLQRDIEVYTCSVKTGDGVESVREEVFRHGQTSVLIGSSGVGKSSLVNQLTGGGLKTAEVSGATGKGKHTTTTRDLFLLENGAIVIDTPGMREFGIGSGEEAEFRNQFPVIAEFARGCRYRDCTHTGEAGCNVADAMERGELEAEAYDNYLKLMKEQKRFQTSAEEKKRQGKQFGKMVKEAKEYRRKYKY